MHLQFKLLVYTSMVFNFTKLDVISHQNCLMYFCYDYFCLSLPKFHILNFFHVFWPLIQKMVDEALKSINMLFPLRLIQNLTAYFLSKNINLSRNMAEIHLSKIEGTSGIQYFFSFCTKGTISRSIIGKLFTLVLQNQIWKQSLPVSKENSRTKSDFSELCLICRDWIPIHCKDTIMAASSLHHLLYNNLLQQRDTKITRGWMWHVKM